MAGHTGHTRLTVATTPHFSYIEHLDLPASNPRERLVRIPLKPDRPSRNPASHTKELVLERVSCAWDAGAGMHE